MDKRTQNIKRCTRCVMDNISDETIIFDENGQCNYCKTALLTKNKIYFPNKIGKEKLDNLLTEIKNNSKNKKYDCLMGISGGLDSCYLAYLGYKWGLRILAVHIDDGFDTEICKNNITKLVKQSNIEFRTIKPDAEQYNALLKAYLKAGVPNIAAPQDNILFAYLYKIAKKEHIKYFLSGGNFALECILQRGNTFDAMDSVNIKNINKKFGSTKLNKLKFLNQWKRVFDKKIFKIQTIRPLNYIDYNRNRAFSELKEFCDFQYYGSKHLENIFTAFAQLYWFPKKFGVDKRTSHLSSMIVSGQMTREEALKELEKPIYEKDLMEKYINIIKEKLNITDQEFDEIMSNPCHQHKDYKYDRLFEFCFKIRNKLRRSN